MTAQREHDLTEEPILPDDDMDADLEAWVPQDFDRFGGFGASRLSDRAE